MKNSLIICSILLLFFSCSSEPNVIHLRTEKGKKETKVPVAANRVLTMEIEGMTCEMGCGGSIRKELKATGGVDRVEFVDFKDGAKVQTARISFDTNKISVDQMVDIVTNMNDKQFKVGNTSSETIETQTATATNSGPDESEEEKVKISETSFQIPNLLDILSSIIL
ncbi:MAG: heavy-metal-associated domain-containing protein [Flavobacteriia bacterium]